ncbi:hypothetical protein HDU91_006445 [Kappamyces sp. JEL0680]|nr:hypothetical protein HDU91_006445 [Kappamyces sp. JEL0680]
MPKTLATPLLHRSPVHYYFRAISFASLIFGCSCIIYLLQLAGLFLYPVRPVYRNHMRFTQRLFGSLIIVATFLFAPLSIELTGSHEALKQTSFVPIMFFEFIFLSRKWKNDRPVIVKNLTTTVKDHSPLWLLVFPEGTVITENTRSIAQAYAKKMDITFQAKHLIMPRSTGLFHIIRCIEKRADYLYDFTIGYSGLTSDSIPYDDRFKISEIPGFETKKPYDPNEQTSPAFDQWIRQRFEEKDLLLKGFYETGHFPETDRRGEGLKQQLHISPDMQDWVSIAALVFASITSWTWLFV